MKKREKMHKVTFDELKQVLLDKKIDSILESEKRNTRKNKIDKYFKKDQA